MPTQKLPERLMPLAGAHGLRPYYGDIHNHCDLSYGRGSLHGALQNAARQLDFVSVTGHAYWPDMPVHNPDVAHIVDFHVKGFARLEQLWPGHFDTLSAFHQPGNLTILPGYEMHSNAHGDYTIVLRDLDQHSMPKGDTPSDLRQALNLTYGNRAFAFPHHIGYRKGARGINWDTFEEALSPVVELISMHGCSETSLTDRPFLHSMGPCNGTNTIHHGWNLGHIFGVLGNTDHHSGYPGSYGHGRSVVYAPDNSSDDIWNAIHARHTGALTGDNCHLFATLAGAIAGDIVAPMAQAPMQIEAIGGSFIDYIDIVKNGGLVKRISPAITPNAVSTHSTTLESILVLELGWGARGTFHDWSGNLSLEGGEVLAVETRLRGPEVVSPLEGGAQEHQDSVEQNGNRVVFKIRSQANPNNATSATQAIALRVSLRPGARIFVDLCGQTFEATADRLLTGALSGNLGDIDTPAFRLHPLPKAEDWQWCGTVDAGPLVKGDWVAVRMRQSNLQWAWTSPFFCR